MRFISQTIIMYELGFVGEGEVMKSSFFLIKNSFTISPFLTKNLPVIGTKCFMSRNCLFQIEIERKN